MNTDLKDRLQQAMDRRGMKVREVVEATGLSKSAIHFMLDGTTRPETVRAWNIDLLAEALDVDRDWLLYGRGSLNRVPRVKSQSGDARSESQNARLDPAILARADFWLRVEERAGLAYSDMRRAQRIIDLYEMVQTDGGDLSAEHAIALVETARKGGSNGRNSKASRG